MFNIRILYKEISCDKKHFTKRNGVMILHNEKYEA